MSVLKLLASESFLTVNKHLIKMTSLYSAIVYADLASSQLYWNTKEGAEDIWFYRTRETIEEQTSLSGKLQRKALELLIEKELLKTKLSGLPAKTYYLIDSYCLNNLLNLLGSKVIPSSSQKSQQEVPESDQLDMTIGHTNKNKENNNKEEEKKNNKLFEWLSNFYSEQSFLFLEQFTSQPTEKFVRSQISKLGEQRVKNIFIGIEKYCAENPTYCTNRKNLSQVFNKFAESSKTELEEKAEQVISEAYKKLFDEDYLFSVSCLKHLSQLLVKIKEGFASFSNISPEDVKDDSIITALRSFFSLLPEKYQIANQFKLPLINHNYQSIKNEIKQANNKTKFGAKNTGAQGVGNVDSKYGI